MKSTKPGKQRKKMHQASHKERYRMFSAPLSSKLKDSHNISSVPVRSGDTVMIMRGDRKGIEGKVTRVDRKKYRIFLEGVDREKVDGTKVFIPIHPSKVIITRLNLDDKWRKKILGRKNVIEKVRPREETPKKEAKKKKMPSKKAKKSEGK